MLWFVGSAGAFGVGGGAQKFVLSYVGMPAIAELVATDYNSNR